MAQSKSFLVIIFVLVWTFSFSFSPSRGNSCTNPVHTSCMLAHDSLALWCDQTNLSSLPEPMSIKKTQVHPKMSRYLFINQSCVSHLDKKILRHYRYLVILDASQNQIRVLQNKTFRPLSMLESLSLAENNIDKVESGAFTGLQNLQSLDIGNNKLSNLPNNTFRSLSKLKVLKINNNFLERFSPCLFKKLRFLRELDLSGNRLHHFHPKHNFLSLKSLKLHGNHLRSLNRQLFSKVPTLQEIDLSGNSLQCLDDDVFSRAKSIMIIHLKGNPLHTPRKSWFMQMIHNNKASKTILKNASSIISPNGNWICDCRVFHYLRFLYNLDRSSGWKPILDVRCRFPTELKGRMLSSLSEEDLSEHSDCTNPGLPPICPHESPLKFMGNVEDANQIVPKSESIMPSDYTDLEENAEHVENSYYIWILALSVTALVILIVIISLVCLRKRKQDKVRGRYSSVSSAKQLLVKSQNSVK